MALTAEELLAFEDDIAREFAAGNIKAPIHLSKGNEDKLVQLFGQVENQDWVLCGWRSHFHCLLKGVPPDKLKQKIMAGHSVGLCFPEHRILCSGIVGGIAPIAVGLAWSLRKAKSTRHVWCFLGDMTAQTGIVHEAVKYATRQELRSQITWVIEDNGKSVCTDTKMSWGLRIDQPKMLRYEYELGRPHAGIGSWVRF